MSKKEFADSLRRGEVFAGGRKNNYEGVNSSNGVFVTPSLGNALDCVEVKKDGDEVGFSEQATGGVVKIALHKDAKLIHIDYL